MKATKLPFRSTSVDSFGIVRVELVVDSNVVRNDAAPNPQSNFSIIQTWKATPGARVIAVRAYNSNGSVSDLSAISVMVSTTTAQLPPSSSSLIICRPPPVSSSSSTSTSTSSSVSSSIPASSNCFYSASYVSDVTVLDGTNHVGGQAFNKIWRMRNNGVCTWDASFQFIRIGGEAMTTNTVVNVPATAVNATADILVPMIAPTTAGQHTGTWRIRNSSGILIGQAGSIKINVVGGAPPPSSSASSRRRPLHLARRRLRPTCAGTPTIASFTASPTSVAAGASESL